MKSILVAEDEGAIREFVVINLKRAGYTVYEAENGKKALELFDSLQGDVDIALLDIMMPEMDGLAACRELRQKSPNLGIIMLTARSQEMDRVSGLMIGADDYVTKPFSPSELVARVDALYRRVEMNGNKPKKAASEEIVSGDFVLNVRNRTLSHKGKMIELTHVEYQFMECFMTNPGKALGPHRYSQQGLGRRVLWRRKNRGRQCAAAANEDRGGAIGPQAHHYRLGLGV